MEYRVLGKFEVLHDGHPVDLGAFRQRAVLALLLTAPNSVFSTDQIIDGLWGDDGGIDKQNALWVYISRLRNALEPDRGKRTAGSILLTRAPGYLIEAAPEEIDAVRFERMVAEGRALADVDPAAASLVLGEALALWRGRAFEDFTYESFAQTEIARLEELRFEAVEARIDADLKRGMSRELISELESLVRQHPLKERLTGQLMLALHRSARQADALRAYQLLKTRLGEELGIEPSSGLRRLEEQIVTGDEALETRPTTTTTGSGTEPGLAVRGYELREKIGEGAFGVAYRAYQPAVGREVAIKVIRPELANDPGFIRRFQAEAQLVARLEHPHIVPLYDYWREPDAAYLVMRLMRGGSLASVLEHRALSPAQTTTMVDQLGNALQTAHRSGVVHRDIKPANILIDDEGNSYLSDFGIAVGGDDGTDAPSVASTLDAPYASPEQLDRGDVTTTSDIYSLGVVVAQALTGLSGEVDQIRGALPPPVLRVIDRATDAHATMRYQSVDEFVVDLHETLGGTTRARRVVAPEPDVEVVNPYKGLRAFDAIDAVDFHGRERLVERLIARLGQSGTRGRFIAVVGPSGSGKSSVVKAGLLPAIRDDAIPLSGSWFTIEMTPAPHPFEELEAALLGVAVDPPVSLLEQLAGDHGLQRAIRRVLPNDGSQLLLLIDQFEELFTQVDAATANRFLASLVSAVTDDQSRIRVVVTLRADFYDRPLQHRGLGELLRDGTEVITPMTPHELELAISGPLEQHGITFEPALVAELVREVVDRTGALPLLQYTLTELFDHRRGARIDYAAYEQLGGVSGALVKRAEGLLAGLGDEAHDVARQVLLRLVTFGEGADDTRRRVLQSELEQLPIDRGMLRAVLDTFGRHRLLSFDRDPVTRSPTVEISHEALLTEWTRLRDWIDSARHDVRTQRRLAEAMREWVAADCAETYLLRGGVLEQVHGWATTATLPLSGPEQAFLDASVAEHDREVDEAREREQRAVAAERRERQRVRQLVGVGLVAVLVAALAVFGTVQWRSAVNAKGEVDNLLMVADLVTASEAALVDDDPELAVLLAVQSVRETVDLGFATEEAVDAVHFSLHELGVQYEVPRETPVAVRSGPSGLVGVYALAPHDLVELAESAVERRLTDAECDSVFSGPCPARVEIPENLPLRGGLETYAAGNPGLRPLAGTNVTIAASSLGADDGFARQLEAFTELTGIKVDVGSSEDQDVVNVASGNLDRSDLVTFQGGIPTWAQHRALDIARFVDGETLRSDFGEYLLSVATVAGGGENPSGNGGIRAIPVTVDLKGLVYYPKAAFEAAGYEIPTTWDELVALSHQVVADGGTPWCFGFASGAASGWPGTDLLESLVLRVGGADIYDAWTAGEVGFTSPALMEAGRLADALVFEPGFVRGGPGVISSEDYENQLFHMLTRNSVTGETEPACWLHHQASFMLGVLPSGTRIGEDIDFFVLPPVDPIRPTPTAGGALFASALVDRPEVRAFVEFMASPEWGEVWATDTVGGFIPANRRFDISAYGDGADAPAAAVRTAIASAAQSALQADVWRLDASDLMPAQIGGWTEASGPGAFWQGMLDWVDGTRTIDQVLADIDAEWGTLRAEGDAEWSVEHEIVPPTDTEP